VNHTKYSSAVHTLYSPADVPVEKVHSIFKTANTVDFADGSHSLWPKDKMAFSRQDRAAPTAANGDDDVMGTAAPVVAT
jgi:hypothetical protein